jgi:hypothetical protein
MKVLGLEDNLLLVGHLVSIEFFLNSLATVVESSTTERFCANVKAAVGRNDALDLLLIPLPLRA